MKRLKKGTPARSAVDAFEALRHEVEEEIATFAIEKSAPERRYTFGPLYSPGVLDAHGEFSTADDLQEAIWEFDYLNTPLRKQHGDEEIGRIVELVQWPFEHESELSLPGRPLKKQLFPAGTVYAGVVWDEDAWPLVKAGKITGLSMGGTAVRVYNAARDAKQILVA